MGLIITKIKIDQKKKCYGDIQNIIPIKLIGYLKYCTATKHATSIVCWLKIEHVCSLVFLNKLWFRDLGSSLCECGLKEWSVDHIFCNCTNQPSSIIIYPKTSLNLLTEIIF